jgi:hypothetical protein
MARLCSLRQSPSFTSTTQIGKKLGHILVNMAHNQVPERKDRLFNAPHLNITIDSNNPPPVASDALLAARRQTKLAWEAFETAENAIVRTEEDVHAEVLNYISSEPRRPTQLQINVENARFTVRICERRIAETEASCQVLERNIQALEAAARKEPRTIEARATLEVDVEVIEKTIATTREMILTAQAQLASARLVLTNFGPT